MIGARLLTPPGRGAVAVLRIEGDGAAAAVADRLGIPPGRAGGLHVVRPRVAGEVLDEALLVVLDERTVELHVHGSPPLVAELLERLGTAAGVPPASLEERARLLLPAAPCEAAARILLDQAEGALRRELQRLGAVAASELAPGLAALIARARRARFALQPASVVLAGDVNAGKSTLFNLLLGSERVLVAADPGTTRDVITQRVLLGEWPVWLSDTAGERRLDPGGASDLERAGQELGASVRRRADMVLWLVAPGGSDPPPAAAPEPRVRVLASQVDRDPEHRREAGAVSAALRPEQARELVARAFRQTFRLPVRAWREGTAVPFDTESKGALERARELALAGDCAGARVRLEQLAAGGEIAGSGECR